MKITGNKERVNASAEQIFSIASDCRRFGQFLPQQAENVEVAEDYCKFSFQGMATMTLSITEKKPFSKVFFKADNDHHIPASFEVNIADESTHCEVWIVAEMEIPVFANAIVKKPLQQFVDLLAVKIKNGAEKNV